MPSNDTNQKAPPKPASNMVEDIQRLKIFLREYGQALVIAVGLAIALGLGAIAYRNYRQNSALRASQLLINARSSEEIQQMIQQYPNAPVMPLALLSLAAHRFDEGQYEMARNTLVQLKEKFPEHPLAMVSDLGRAQCLEAEGQFEQALQLFSAFEKDHANHFLTPLARFGKARCLQQLGRFAEARAEYEDFIAAYPESEWSSIAESAILFVDKDERSAAISSETTPAAWPLREDSLAASATEEGAEPAAVESVSKTVGESVSMDASQVGRVETQEVNFQESKAAVPEPEAPEAPLPEGTAPSH